MNFAALSVEDVARLMADPSANTRAGTAAKVAKIYAGPKLNDKERAVAHEVVTLLMRDAETLVRRTLAENLKDNPDVPRDVARRLASDIAEVAAPILESSVALSDDDLVEFVTSQSNAHRTAVAKRATVSQKVSEVLVERGNEGVVATLMENRGADISEKSFNRAVDRFPTSERVQGAMVSRDKLPIMVAERLVAVVSEKLREQLMVRHELPADIATDLVLQARERALLSLIADGNEGRDVEGLVDELARNGRLTPTLVLRALTTGDMNFFETALARLAQVPVQNAYKLIHDSGKRGLEAIYEKCGLPPKLLPVVKAAVDVAAETHYDGGPADRPRYVERMLERVLTQFEGGGVDAEDLDWMIGRLARAQSDAA
jgi:uncharacterized protein (DUF2336 family)